MITGTVSPDEPTFQTLARQRRVVPVTRRLLADGETPVGVYRKLAGGPGTFLLESAEQGAGSAGTAWSRYSFIGVRSAATLTESAGGAHWLGDPPDGVPTEGDPVEVLRATVAALTGPAPDTDPVGGGLPPLTGGLVGYLSYDFVRRLERIPEHTEDDLALPEFGLLLATDLVVLDHFDGTAILVANAVLPAAADPVTAAAAYHHAIGRLDAMTTALSRPNPPMVSMMDAPAAPGPAARSRTAAGAYPKAVEEAKEAIRVGECFQIVLAQRFERDTSADPLDVYRVLRATNPSPYMYLLRFDDFDVVGSSPEAHLKVTVTAGGTRRAMLHPIAGTRRRGATPQVDAALATELLNDPKERAEHVMLVDLGRNDLGRVCRPGTVEVPEFATVERYSHVMHIVSTVVGELREDRTAFDALAATFPAGTLSGAPKVRAMEIIEELEPTRRGLYGGTVGYFGFGGDLDMAIAIRTALIRRGRAYVQAGAGIVADSDPAAEERETQSKAAAVLVAIAAAETLRPAR
ncbi:anthranilate synthase component I [Solwaraspora sp. WMMA2080]|uniref:anthranilate synthase component I n=1 Tax=unclassified Solwaraspora TaxID=2627926 RepID=UPI00248B0198|nr:MULTISPECIES: anthranilate synthase component I [unclassified Solwaraspora]WBB94933.1 anthranilate synthase component I [Solwaraspora sp. WMMA2059]WBC21184.1 anthranilate synthase component I [Solwaraspora sp. WMMA2080]